MTNADPLISVAVLGKMLFGLIIILGIMALMVLLLRFLQKQKLAIHGSKNTLKILQSNHIGSKQKLAVVAWGETQYLVGLGPSGGFLIDKKPLETNNLKKEAKK